MKKIILLSLGAFMFFASAISVSAQVATTTAVSTTTTSTTSSDVIAILQAQIQKLLQQVSDLQAQLSALTKSSLDLQGSVQVLQLGSRLTPGMRGEDVKHLQEVLSTDRDIFQKENVTGYYGPMTEQAVKYFQKHFGIDPLGVVGPKTMEKINEILKEHNTHRGEDLQENDLGDIGDKNDVENDNQGDDHQNASTTQKVESNN